MRAAIYARFSTDLQNERSIEDQVALCRQHGLRQDLEIGETYADRARSGASVFGRDELMRLMADAQAHRFDVVLVEALDRLSRDMEDLAGIHKRLTFLGIEIRAVHDGTATTMLVGLRGLVGQLYREDNAQKIRRGMAGRVRAGRAGGGLTYGYAPVAGDVGCRTIVPEEAAVVRRIFNEYLAGRSPRAIAADLNAEAIAPPRGSRWNASTLNGNPARGSGILRNELYAGRIVWNKVRMVKDPETGRRVSRPNPRSEWHATEAPDLAIVTPEIFAAVQARKEAHSQESPERQRRPQRLLSGLLRCGACGAGMSVKGKDRSGKVRIRCSAYAESRTCPDPHTYYLDVIEAATLEGLRSEFKDPRVTAKMVQAYNAERARLARKTTADRSRLESRLATADRQADRLTKRYVEEDDPDRRALIGAELDTAIVEQKALRSELADLPDQVDVVALHPGLLADYERQLSELSATLGRPIQAGDADAARALRNLIETVTVSRTDDGRIAIDVTGRLSALLGEEAYPNGIRKVWGGTMVAEVRYRRSPPMAFILSVKAMVINVPGKCAGSRNTCFSSGGRVSLLPSLNQMRRGATSLGGIPAIDSRVAQLYGDLRPI